MNPQDYHDIIFPVALSLVPEGWDSPEARAQLLAIALQESQFKHRRQIGGPALGFYQFELIGVRGTFLHHRTGPDTQAIAKVLGYETAERTHLALEDNDILATVLARYNIYNYPAALPVEGDAEEGWRQYLRRWRPGRPRQKRWESNFREAWRIVNS